MLDIFAYEWVFQFTQGLSGQIFMYAINILIAFLVVTVIGSVVSITKNILDGLFTPKKNLLDK